MSLEPNKIDRSLQCSNVKYFVQDYMKQPHKITYNLLHILPQCITSRTKYSGKSWKSFGLA